MMRWYVDVETGCGRCAIRQYMHTHHQSIPRQVYPSLSLSHTYLLVRQPTGVVLAVVVAGGQGAARGGGHGAGLGGGRQLGEEARGPPL